MLLSPSLHHASICPVYTTLNGLCPVKSFPLPRCSLRSLCPTGQYHGKLPRNTSEVFGEIRVEKFGGRPWRENPVRYLLGGPGPGSRSPEPGARSPEPGARSPEPFYASRLAPAGQGAPPGIENAGFLYLPSLLRLLFLSPFFRPHCPDGRPHNLTANRTGVRRGVLGDILREKPLGPNAGRLHDSLFGAWGGFAGGLTGALAGALAREF